MRIGSFFSGIGGFELGARGFYDVGFQSEVEPLCCDVLKSRFPGVKNFGDINLINPKDLPDAEFFTAGFPCQDVSLARGGRGRDGLDGSRTGLFYKLLDIINSKSPELLILENVPGLRSSNAGRDFAAVLHHLSISGYDVGWRSLNSRFFGVPQNRERVYILGKKRDQNSASFISRALFDKGCMKKMPKLRLGFTTQSALLGPRDEIVPMISYCISATTGRHTGTDWSRTYVTGPNYVRRFTPSETESLQGFPKGWTKIKQEQDDSPRYHAIGNAVTVDVARELFSRISRLQSGVLSDYPDEINLEQGLVTSQPVASLHDWGNSEFSSTNAEETTTVGFKWSRAGTYLSNELNQSQKINLMFSPRKDTEIVAILDKEIPVFSEYVLSKNAIQGIIRRTDSQNRTLFSPMRRVLDEIANS